MPSLCGFILQPRLFRVRVGEVQGGGSPIAGDVETPLHIGMAAFSFSNYENAEVVVAGDVTACSYVITFCVSRRRRKIYCGHARLCVCVCVCVCVCMCVCLSASPRPYSHTTARTGCNLGAW